MSASITQSSAGPRYDQEILLLVDQPFVQKLSSCTVSKGGHPCNSNVDVSSAGYSSYGTFTIENAQLQKTSTTSHFFIHPRGDVVWFGSSSKYHEEKGLLIIDTNDFDGTIQTNNLQKEIAEICNTCKMEERWGFYSLDSLVKISDKADADEECTAGTVVTHIKHRLTCITGTLSAVMVAQLVRTAYGYIYCVLSQDSSTRAFPGTIQELLLKVESHNKRKQGESLVIVLAACEFFEITLIDFGVYGNSLEHAWSVLNEFCLPVKAAFDSTATTLYYSTRVARELASSTTN